MLWAGAMREQVVADNPDYHITDVAKVLGKEWKKKQASKPFPKDPHAPKRAKSAYIFFVNEQRPEVVEEFPDMKVTDIMCELGKRWGQLSSTEKETYDDMAADAKAAYKKALAKYQGSAKHKKYQKEKSEYQAKQKDAKRKASGGSSAKKVKKPKRRSASRSSRRG